MKLQDCRARVERVDVEIPLDGIRYRLGVVIRGPETVRVRDNGNYCTFWVMAGPAWGIVGV